jgi:hypothetical protein
MCSYLQARNRNSIREVRDSYTVLVGKHQSKISLGEPGLDGRIILKLILCGLDSSGSGNGSMTGSCE